MVTRATTWIVIVALLLPAAAALSNVQLLKDGYELTYLPDEEEVDVTVQFRPPHQFVSNVDISQIQDGALTNSITAGANCPRRTCEASMTINPQAQTILHFFIPSDNEDHQIIFELPVDDQAPIIEEVSIAGCEDECAYSQQTPITIQIRDRGPSGITPQAIQATLDGSTQEATCEEQVGSLLTCTIHLETTASGELTVTATDRAGNQARERTLNLIYDNTKPVIKQTRFIELYGEATDIDVLPGGVPAVLEVLVEEQLTPEITLTTSDFVETGSCEETDTDNDYSCTVTFTPRNEAYTQQANITVTDLAGNTQNRTLTLRVEESDQETQPQFWQASASPLRKVDHETWTVNPISIPVTLKLDEIVSARPDPLHIHVNNCRVKGASSVNAAEVETIPRADKNTQFEIRIAPQAERALDPESDLLNNPQINCSVDIYSRLSGVAYTTPQTINVTIEPEFLTALPPGPEAIRQQAERAEKRMQDLQNVHQFMNRMTSSMGALCRPPRALDTAGAALTGAAQGLYLAPAPGSGAAGEVLERSGDSLMRTSERILDYAGADCSMLTCSIDASEDDDFTSRLGVSQTFATLAGVENPQQLVDPHKSIVIALSTGCLPAIQYHLEQYLALSCSQQECLAQVPTGLATADACAYGYRESVCNLISGQILHTVPAVNIASTALDHYAAALENPLATVGIASTILCSGADITGRLGRAICKTSEAGDRAMSTAQVVNDISHSWNDIQNVGQGRSNYCGQIQNNIDRLRYTDRRPFIDVDRSCYGAYSTHEEAGTKYVTMNGKTCRATHQTDDSRTAEMRGYGKLTGMELDCEVSATSGAVRNAQNQHETCIENGLMKDFESLPSSDRLQEANNELDQARQAYKEAQTDFEERANQVAKAQQERDALLREYEQAANRAQVSGGDEIDWYTWNPSLEGLEEYQGIPWNDLPSSVQDSLEEEGINPVVWEAAAETTTETTTGVFAIKKDEIPTREEILSGELTEVQKAFLAQAGIDPTDVDAATQALEEGQDELIALEEALEERQERVKNAEEDQEDVLDQVALEGYQAGLGEFSGFMKGMMGSAIGWSQLGVSVDRSFGLGIANTGVGSWFNDASEAIAGLSEQGTDLVGSAICSVGRETPQDATSVLTQTGSPVAHLHGAFTTYGDLNSYRVDFAAANTHVADATATILLRSDTEQLILEEDRSLSSPVFRVGGDAYGELNEARFSHACVQFSHDIEDLFGAAYITGSQRADMICTQLRENQP